MSVAWSSSSSSSPLLLLSLSSSSRCPPRPPAQLRPAIHSVLCRTSTTTIHVSAPCRTSTMTIHAQLRSGREHLAWILAVRSGREHLAWILAVFPAGPQPRVSTPSVPCRTSTASIHAKCSLPDLMRYAR